MARIVLVGEDSSLLATRAEVLKRTGASIACCSGNQAKAMLEEETFDIVVLCHSLPDSVSTELIGYVHRRWPEAKILMVVTERFTYRATGVEVTSSTDPGRLIELTQQLLESLPNHRLHLAEWERKTDPNCKIATLQNG
jgi:Response regulator containing CheY-like receiver, AAA-type ATPase, and DNA-binding domains